MSFSQHQGEFFKKNDHLFTTPNTSQEISLSRELIEQWQNRIQLHQSSLFKGLGENHEQGSFFDNQATNQINNFEPLKLTPLSLSFWRWPKSPNHGPAIYLVMDRLERQDSYLMLYIGETIAAEKRWKGEHDCKYYLANYSEALQEARMNSQLSIRFWADVPKSTPKRRQLEQDLIQLWLPPFNKETRNRWETPFTSDIK
tara:strand:+ start:7563 stop:8162 length:600 start_codon:yes stop_codon:yes gene_type:complete